MNGTIILSVVQTWKLGFTLSSSPSLSNRGRTLLTLFCLCSLSQIFHYSHLWLNHPIFAKSFLPPFLPHLSPSRIAASYFPGQRSHLYLLQKCGVLTTGSRGLLLLLSHFSRVRLCCDPIDGSISGSAVPGILQARTLQWVAISFSSAWKWKVKVKSLSCVRPSATPWTAAFQAPLPMGFSRQEYRSECHCLLWCRDYFCLIPTEITWNVSHQEETEPRRKGVPKLVNLNFNGKLA